MDGSQNHTQSLLERVQIHTNSEFVGPEDFFFWRTADSLSVQGKQGTYEQLSLNKKTKQKRAVDYSGNNKEWRVCKLLKIGHFINSTSIFFTCGLLSGFWTHCSLFFACPFWVSLFGYFPVLVKLIWLFLDYSSPVSVLPDYFLCVYKSWVLLESWSVLSSFMLCYLCCMLKRIICTYILC